MRRTTAAGTPRLLSVFFIAVDTRPALLKSLPEIEYTVSNSSEAINYLP
jgi:hypothetical protein